MLDTTMANATTATMMTVSVSSKLLREKESSVVNLINNIICPLEVERWVVRVMLMVKQRWS